MIRDNLLLLAYCFFIFMLSAQSVLLATPLDFPHKDKLIHATAYAIMGWFAWHAFAHHVKARLSLAMISIVFVSLYGVSDEFHQSFVIGRNADVLDWLADTVGAGCMILALYYKQPFKETV